MINKTVIVALLCIFVASSVAAENGVSIPVIDAYIYNNHGVDNLAIGSCTGDQYSDKAPANASRCRSGFRPLNEVLSERLQEQLDNRDKLFQARLIKAEVESRAIDSLRARIDALEQRLRKLEQAE